MLALAECIEVPSPLLRWLTTAALSWPGYVMSKNVLFG
jgi:hypothetical protein